jgi:hypothetical protein
MPPAPLAIAARFRFRPPAWRRAREALRGLGQDVVRRARALPGERWFLIGFGLLLLLFLLALLGEPTVGRGGR